MRPFSDVCLAVFALGALATGGLGSSSAQAQNGAVKALFEKYDLLGFFAWDCGKPADKTSNWYFVNRLVDPDHVQRDFMESATSRQWFAIIDRASETGRGGLSVSGIRDGQRFDSVWRMEKNRMLQWDITRSGVRIIAGGRLVSTGKDVQWLHKCGAVLGQAPPGSTPTASGMSEATARTASVFEAAGAPRAAESNPVRESQKPPKDRSIAGVFSPERVASDQEEAAKKARTSGAAPFQRGRRYYFVWSALSPAEFEALARHTVLLVSVWTRKPDELPVSRIYIRADGQELPLYKVASWKTPVDNNSLTAAIYGSNREDGFYLVPGDAMLRKGQIVMDLADRTGWVMLELPSAVASDDPRRFPNLTPAPNAKPGLRELQALIQRKFSGFPMPQSLP